MILFILITFKLSTANFKQEIISKKKFKKHLSLTQIRVTTKADLTKNIEMQYIFNKKMVDNMYIYVILDSLYCPSSCLFSLVFGAKLTVKLPLVRAEQ